MNVGMPPNRGNSSAFTGIGCGSDSFFSLREIGIFLSSLFCSLNGVDVLSLFQYREGGVTAMNRVTFAILAALAIALPEIAIEDPIRTQNGLVSGAPGVDPG